MNIDRLIAALPHKSASERAAMRGNAERWLASGTDEQQAAAQRLLATLDQLVSSEATALATRLEGAGLATRVVEAFRANRMSGTEERIVRVLLDNPGSTSAKLSAAINWKAQTWHMHFGTMCGNRSDYLWATPIPAKRSSTFLSGVLATYDEANSGFTMRPEAVAGFAALGISAKLRNAA